MARESSQHSPQTLDLQNSHLRWRSHVDRLGIRQFRYSLQHSMKRSGDVRIGWNGNAS
jgi:hypothetical protein